MLFSQVGRRMNVRKASCWLGCAFVFIGALYAFQRPFRQYPGVEYFQFDLSPDWQEQGSNWPWLYAVHVGEWGFTEEDAKVMREYLLRGGFFMADDLHGVYEWEM